MPGVFYLYFLKLRKGWFYVGVSKNPKARIKDHYEGFGCDITKKYRPLKILGVWELSKMTYPEAEKIETAFTLETMAKKGHKVRGGLYHHLKENVALILKSNIIPENTLRKYNKIYVEMPAKKKNKLKDDYVPYKSMPFDEAVACLYDHWQANGQVSRSMDEAEKKILKKGWYMK